MNQWTAIDREHDVSRKFKEPLGAVTIEVPYGDVLKIGDQRYTRDNPCTLCVVKRVVRKRIMANGVMGK